MQRMLLALWREDSGQDLTEWALLICFVTLAAMAVVGVGGSSIHGIAVTTSSNLDAADRVAGS